MDHVLILSDHFTVTVLIAGTGHYVNMVDVINQYNFLPITFRSSKNLFIVKSYRFMQYKGYQTSLCGRYFLQFNW